MSVNICMGCNEMYDVQFLIRVNRDGYDYICPKKGCDGSVIELDELIAPTIIELNNKGYYTRYCCSGHWYSNEHTATYIAFSNKDCVPDELPEGFKLYKSGETIRLSNDEAFDDLVERFRHINEVNVILLEWAKKLEANEWDYL